jgi:hypothetical protein
MVSVCFTDPPHNVPIGGHVSGLGKTRHREFAMATGEMSEQGFAGFLGESLGLMADEPADVGSDDQDTPTATVTDPRVCAKRAARR